MRAVIQRVNSASVSVESQGTVSIGRGYLILVGVGNGDGAADIEWMVEKIGNLRVFDDGEGKLNLSIRDVAGEVLVVSQFTLYGDCRKGRRPSYSDAAPLADAKPLYELFVARLRESGLPVNTGVFQAYMKVGLENDGPVTLLLDSRKAF